MDNNGTKQSRKNTERGSALLTTLLVIAGLYLYSSWGFQFVDADRSSAVHLPIIVILAIVGLFVIGCSLHLRSLGSRDYQELRDELEKGIDRMSLLIESSKQKLRAYENHSVAHFAGLSRKGQETLSIVRRMVCALETRYCDVKQLLSTGHNIDLLDAHDIYNRRLVVAESSLTALIESDPIPALLPSEWEGSMARFHNEVESELRGLEMMESSYKHVA